MKWLKYPGLWIHIEETKMKRQYLSFSQRVQIYNFIQTVGMVKGEYWEYNEGWSDAKVAEQFKASLGNVITVRQELGKLKTFTGAVYFNRIAELEARIETLEQYGERIYTAKLTEINERLNRLEALLDRQVNVLLNANKELEAKINKLQLKEHFRA
jgi:hypothetical protein